MVIYLFYCFNSIDVKKYIDKNMGWCLTLVGVYIYLQHTRSTPAQGEVHNII